MKNDLKRLLAVLLVMVITVSACTVFGASATENDAQQAPAAVNSVDPTEAAAEPETQAPTVPPTEAPTQAPTAAPTEAPAPTVGKVTGLMNTTGDALNRITLEWNPVEDADGYYVYMSNVDTGSPFKRVAQTTQPTVTVSNLTATTLYTFRVSAYVIQNGRVYEGAVTTKKTASRPDQPTGLKRYHSTPDWIELRWNRNTKATGYRIYRTEAGKKEVLFKTIYGNANTTLNDKSVKAGQIYTYRVKCFREANNTTYHSAGSVMTFRAGLYSPNFSLTSRCQRINLTWKKNSYATGYDIYYSTKSAESSFIKLAYTTNTFYNTAKLSNNTKYYFRIYAVYKSGSTRIVGTSCKKDATAVAKAYGKATGSTYVEISIDQQHMWFYKNGKLMADTDVVTGNNNSMDTPKGYFSIFNKARNTNLTGPGYVSFVNYWMAFYRGCGIHDASWRSKFGGTIYKGNGSHGCVNTPKSQVVKIYNNAPVGTPVIVY